MTTRHRKESELETDRLCSAQQQAEKLLETRERAHRHQIKGLEEQVIVAYYLINVSTSPIGWNSDAVLVSVCHRCDILRFKVCHETSNK